MSNWTSPAGPDSNRRRSQRVMLSLPVTLSGKTAQGPFTENTHTMVVNAHGALVGMQARLSMGQTLQLKSATSPEEQECKIIWVGPTADGRTQYGIEFTKPVQKFWGVSFPPADWSPSASGVMAEARKK